MKASVAAGLTLLALGAATPAYAQSSQESALELKLGIYQPQIDSEAALKGATPYKDFFKNGTILLFEAEYDYQFFHAFGSLALGLSAGYGEIYGHGVYSQGPNKGQTSGDLTALKVFPLHVLAIYRFDVLALRYHIPLVPFAKLGLDPDFYEITNGTGGQSVDTEGKKGIGFDWGWEGDLGLAFLLDVLDPDLARDFDLDVGINHSYLFGEWSYTSVNDFGGKALTLSDQFFKFGIALEF
jgi:hypothetical protein